MYFCQAQENILLQLLKFPELRFKIAPRIEHSCTFIINELKSVAYWTVINVEEDKNEQPKKTVAAAISLQSGLPTTEAIHPEAKAGEYETIEYNY